MKNYWRVEDAWIAVDRSPGAERELDRSFSDEVAIDFPAVTSGSDKVIRMRLAFDEADLTVECLSAEITLSRRQAGAGAAVPLEVPLRWTCRQCGDRCEGCEGSGHARRRRMLTVSVPAGVVDGARFSFSVSPARGPRTRVDVRVAVT